ncbi:hypothetical protein JK359_14230 [Streptomyces actinomycinicus]|uniref:Uncharacterized protein n=1 Tax=Streptomyces actinomycinicus TaxID=1695166 RepID=A0A937EJF4_9ACTN|nr:hypothetical protein [Streptomyces actinomycinicus]MBL1083129.1 hypothetical protein [Streptomyces actinomycinicus]
MPHENKAYEVKDLPDQPAGFVWDLSGTRLVISGSCPECGHAVDHPVPDVMPGAVTMGWRWRRERAREEVPREVYMRCRCLQPHAGDEEEAGGCGAAWVAIRPAGAGS